MFNNGIFTGNENETVNSRITVLEDNEYKVAYFAEISSNTGTITIPAQATILLDQFPGGVDALVSTLSSGVPTGINPSTAGGAIVDVSSFDALGNYTLTGIPSGYPVALVYILKIKAKYWANLTTANIITAEQVAPSISDGIAAGTDTYTVSIPGITAYNKTLKVSIQFTNANTGASTLNINGIGPIDLKKSSSVALSASDIKAGQILLLEFDGTNFQVVGGGGGGGATGATGPQGSQGTQGSQGSLGPTGATGPQGSQGSQGSQSTAAGTPGTPGTQGTQGSQGSLGPTGATGATGPQGTQGSQGSASTVPGPQGTQGSQGSLGPTGPTGATGQAGNALNFNFAAATGATSPGTGIFRFDTTGAAITSIYISEKNTDGTDVQSWIAKWALSTNTTKSYVYIFKKADPTVWAIYQVSNLADNGDWDTVTVTYVASNGTFTDGDLCFVSFVPTGDRGATGAQGATGATGAQGTQGSASTVPGPQGTQGSLGPTGATGATGPQGSQGTQGSASTVPGPQGTQGTMGTLGSQGSQGSIGTNFVMAPSVTTMSGVTGAVPDVTTTQILNLINIASGMTIYAPSGVGNNGQSLTIRIKNATATGYSITWNQVVATGFTSPWAAPTLPTRAASAPWMLVTEFMYDTNQSLNKWVLINSVRRT